MSETKVAVVIPARYASSRFPGKPLALLCGRPMIQHVYEKASASRADLVLVETRSANMFPIYDPYSALVYSAGPSNVDMVFVEGTCVVKDGKLAEKSVEVLRGELAGKMAKTAFAEEVLFSL